MKRNERNWSRFVCGIGFFVVSSCASPQSCIYRWSLDESPESKTVEDVIRGQVGTLNGATLGVAGKFGTAISFDGDDFVISNLSDQTLSEYTVALWVRASAVGQSRFATVLNNFNNEAGASNDSFQIDVDGETPGSYRIYFDDSNYVIFGSVLTEWQHLAVSYDGKTVKTYIDGVLKNSLSLAPSLAGTKFRHIVLGRNRGGNRYFNGLIDELVIYNRVLAANEIADLSAGKTNASCAK